MVDDAFPQNQMTVIISGLDRVSSILRRVRKNYAIATLANESHWKFLPQAVSVMFLQIYNCSNNLMQVKFTPNFSNIPLHTNAQASNFCVIPSCEGATPSQINSLGSIQGYLLKKQEQWNLKHLQQSHFCEIMYCLKDTTSSVDIYRLHSEGMGRYCLHSCVTIHTQGVSLLQMQGYPISQWREYPISQMGYPHQLMGGTPARSV